MDAVANLINAAMLVPTFGAAAQRQNVEKEKINV